MNYDAYIIKVYEEFALLYVWELCFKCPRSIIDMKTTDEGLRIYITLSSVDELYSRLVSHTDSVRECPRIVLSKGEWTSFYRLMMILLSDIYY